MATLAICAYLCLVAILGTAYCVYHDKKSLKE